MTLQFRPYQLAGMDAVRASFRAGRRAPILVAPTGAGKTVVASGIIDGAVNRGREVWFLAHRFELIAQTCAKLAACGIRHRVIAPPDAVRRIQADQFRSLRRSFVDPMATVAVGTVQTASRRIGRPGRAPGLMLIDECHLSIAPTYRKIAEAFPQALLIGLTATPTRLDGKGLGQHAGGLYDDLIVLCQPQELVDAGFLVPSRFFAAERMPDVSRVRMTGGDYDRGELGARVDKPTLIGDAVAHYRRVAHGRPAMAFCVSVEHAEHTAEQFRAAGYRAVAVSGDTDPGVRAKAVAGLGDGSVDIVCNCALYIEGLDQPAIACILMMTPTKSVTRYLQTVGRGLRPHPESGKVDCIVLDHAGNCYAHGFPADPREWSLDGRPKRERSADTAAPDVKVATCTQCFAIHAPAPACPVCGHVYPATTRTIEHREGSLVELSPAARAAARAQAEAQKAQQRIQRKREERDCRTLDELIALGTARNYRHPRLWAERIFGFRHNYQPRKTA